MKNLVLQIIAFFISQLAFCQVPDSSAIKKDSTVYTTPVVAPVSTATTVSAEKNKTDGNKRSFKEKFGLGLGSSFWITPNQTYVELAPSIAYFFPKVLTTGVGYRYIYRHDRVLNNDLNAYGPNVFVRANVTKRIYLWTEYEILKTQYFNESYVGDESKSYDSGLQSWFGGIGYMRSLGKRGRGGLSVQVLYNFLHERNVHSPYYSPVIYRVGYFF